MKSANTSIEQAIEFYHLGNFTEANRICREILKKNYRELLVITGKGLHSNTDKDTYSSKNFSKLRYSIPDYIKHNEDLNDLIISIKSASIPDGGDGAIIIKFKTIK